MKKIGNLKKLSTALILAMAIPVLSFSSEYVSNTSKILSKNGKEMGTIYKGSQIEKNKNSFKITAWVMDGNEYILFYSNEERIKLARIDRSFIKNQVVLEKTKDVYDVEWKKVTLEFKTNVKNFSDNTNKNLWTNESELYQRCGSCHSLHPYNEFNANQWPSIVKTMENNAGFTKDEAKNVSIFLQYKSLKGN